MESETPDSHPPSRSTAPSDPPGEAERYALSQRATWVSVAVNIVLTILQVIVGLVAHSQSLIAHGLHSFSDLLSDFLVLFANRESRHPADEAHPYGHARIETAATLILGVSLIIVGGGILWDAAGRLQTLATVAPVEISALWIAIVTVIAKEGLFRYLMKVADRLRSQLLAANALHTRADAASALVVVAGIAGSLLGWRFLDLLAAILMGFMILKLGGQLAWEALRELIDTGLEDDDVASIRATLAATPGVVGVHELRTRRMAHRALVDAHVQVDGYISVSEGHQIAESARSRVLRENPRVLDVLVHIDPEDDRRATTPFSALPLRADLCAALSPVLAGLPEPQRIVFHYLGGKVDAEIFLETQAGSADPAFRDIESRIAACLRDNPGFGAISFNLRVAPI